MAKFTLHTAHTAPKTFQKTLIFYNMLIIICIACVVSIYNFTSYKNDVIKNETNNSVNRVQTLSDRASLAYDEMVNILLNCTERKSLFLTTSLKSPQTDSNERMALYAADVLRDFCAISGYSEYIYKITLYNKDQLLIQAGSSSGSSDDLENITNAPWFDDYLTKNTSQYKLTLEESPFPLGRYANPQIIPLVRPLKYNNGSDPKDAWVFLGISPKLFNSLLDVLPKDRILYITTEEGEIISSLNGSRLDASSLIQELASSGTYNGVLRRKISGEDCVITYQKQLVSGLLMLEIMPVEDMNFDHTVIGNTVVIIFFFCITIGLILSVLFSRQLGAPIKRLTNRLKLISQGDFIRDISIETDDEIGMIGKQINQMSGHISELLDTRVKSEKEKKDLEIKMLQAQINPHFLYNTLDSIKWIATIQKNSGIVQVVTALSSLLKNMAKGFNEKVTLRQELDFLNNYVTIEKIRYIELFDVEIDVDSEYLYDAKIIKLTLQPLVENAIFSGIEPSGRSGLIKIHAYTKDNILYVSVTDNGIGISEENIKKLLTDTSRITKSNMSGIGLPNVDRRLKLVYGEDYGIKIDSVLDEYTTITVSLPLEL